MPQGTAWSKIKLEIAPLTSEYIRKHEDLFWEYVSERYQIYRRRQKGKSFPWTDDPTLRDYKFTNVFRREDTGTQALIRLVGSTSRLSVSDIVWRVVQYRWPNHYTLFEDWGWIPRGFKRKEWIKKILATHAKHGQWHTTAHIVLQSNFKQKRYENYLDYLKGLDDDLEQFTASIVDSDSMDGAFKSAKKLRGLGGFTAYEILIDLCYLGVLPDNFRDQFANSGPGCTEGLQLIWPQAKSQKELLACMIKLRDGQGKGFKRNGLKKTPRLTVQDIEFCLCEFSKYVKIRHGTGRARRYRSGVV